MDQPQSPMSGAQAATDVDSLINNFSADDLIDNYAPKAGEPGAPQPPISGPDGPLPQPVAAPQQQPTLLHKIATGLNATDAPEAAALGVAKAALQTKDFAFGEPSADQKWAPRKWVEEQEQALKADPERGMLNGFLINTTAWGVGFAGLGKFSTAFLPLKAGAGLVRGEQILRGGLASGIVMDPHESHLSDFVQAHPSVANPVNALLASKPDDTEAVGRFKQAIDGMLYDAVAGAAFTLAVRSVQNFKFGNIKAANELSAQADEAFAKVAQGQHKEKFFSHDEYLAQQQAAADAADTRLAQVDDMGGARKDFLKGAPPSGATPQIDQGMAATLRGEGLPHEIAREARGLEPAFTGPADEAFPKVAREEPPVVDASHLGEPFARGPTDWAQGPTDPLHVEGTNSILPGEGSSTYVPNAVSSAVPPLQGRGAAGEGAARPASGGGEGGPGTNVQDRGMGGIGGDSAGHPANGAQRLPATDAGLAASDSGLPASPGVGSEPRVLNPGDAESLLNNLQRDNDAIIAHGGRDAAIAAGYKFKSGPDYIPWQKLNTDGAPQEFIASAIEQGSAHIAAKRGGNAEGVLTDKAVNKMVEQRAAVWNEDPAQLRGALKAAGDKASELAANMETSFLIANKAFQDTYELAQRINAGNFAGFGSEAEALAALQHRLATSVEWYANGQALVSNFGRGLRRAQGQFRFTPQQLENIRTSDPKALAAFIEQTGGDPKLLAKAGRVSLLNQIGDVAAGYRAANLLWGWKTHVVNFVGNGIMLGWRPAESLVGSVVKQTIGTLRGDEGAIAAALSTRAQAIKEIAYTKASLMDSFNAARAAFVEGDSVLMPHSTEHTALSQVGSGNLKDIFQPMDTADGIWANTLKAGGMGMALLKGDLRLMGAADEVFKQIRYRSVVQAKAHVEADAMGLTGQKLKDFVSKKLDDAFDDVGKALDPEAFREAQFSTFQNDYVKPEDSAFGPLASSYANAAAQSPWLRATVTPFIKTPTNLFRYGVKLTPGLNLLQVEYKNALMGLKGEAEQIRAMGQMGLGIMTASIAGGLWASGNITGAGPLNPQQKAQWIAQGNREYSIAWTNAEGKREYFELSRWDPIGLPLTLVADSLNLLHHANTSLSPSDMASIAAIPVIALTKMMANKTYTKSIGDALNVITDNSIETGAKAGAYWRRTVPGLLPFSTLLQTVTNDPYLREARTTLDAFMARVPGWADSHIAPRRDIYGDPILAPQGFGATEIKNPVNDALNQSFAITGNYLAPPAAKNANTGGVDLRDFTIEGGRQAYDRYQELAGHPPGAPSLKDSLTKLVERPDFQKLTHGGPTEKGTQASAIMDIVKKYREAAFNQLLRESPSLKAAVNQRKLDIWRADMVGAKDPKAVAGQARMDNINKLLHPYGLNLPTVQIPQQ